jgi:hypothetical protein
MVERRIKEARFPAVKSLDSVARWQCRTMRYTRRQ